MWKNEQFLYLLLLLKFLQPGYIGSVYSAHFSDYHILSFLSHNMYKHHQTQYVESMVVVYAGYACILSKIQITLFQECKLYTREASKCKLPSYSTLLAYYTYVSR